MRLEDSIASLNGIGEQRARLYKKLGVATIGDLISLYPRDYLDYSQSISINECVPECHATVKAVVSRKHSEQRIRKGLSLFKAQVTDGTASMTITFFNAKYKFEQLKEGEEYYFRGKVTGTLLRHEMSSPMFVKADVECLLQPVYPLTEGLNNSMVQRCVKTALELWGDCLQDSLSHELRQSYGLCQLRYAIENIHFPKDEAALRIARNRLIFEELLVLQLGMAMLRKRSRASTSAILTHKDFSEFTASLPFCLTDGQIQAIKDGIDDMHRSVPMNRLVQGDVGSGKTMVAAALCYCAAKSGLQTAVMAPTQILAEQHYDTFEVVLSPLGIKCCKLTGSQKAAERREQLEGLRSGKYMVAIGTHALLQESVEFMRLGLVVTDEQHRFGVEQRAVLAHKGENPHLLVMSATPIPRTLALMIYGDLDISLIKELPKGRLPIVTYAISSEKRGRALGFLKKQLDNGRQAYIICPLIEDNESELISIEQYITALKGTPLARYQMESLNGKLSGAKKEEIMSRFNRGEVQILVSTTVVEVGVDVPNATVMMIENAERFGLSQLHQLRGRVGRGENQSYCILVSDNQGEENKFRIDTMVNTTDGFKIAEEDLRLRGPGDFFGYKQHGLPALKVANLVEDMQTLKLTQELAQELLKEDKELAAAGNEGLRRAVGRLFEQNEQGLMN